jgi:hypothetical protein
MEYRAYFEKAQCRQRRRKPPRYVTNYGDGTLDGRKENNHASKQGFMDQRPGFWIKTFIPAESVRSI